MLIGPSKFTKIYYISNILDISIGISKGVFLSLQDMPPRLTEPDAINQLSRCAMRSFVNCNRIIKIQRGGGQGGVRFMNNKDGFWV